MAQLPGSSSCSHSSSIRSSNWRRPKNRHNSMTAWLSKWLRGIRFNCSNRDGTQLRLLSEYTKAICVTLHVENYPAHFYSGGPSVGVIKMAVARKLAAGFLACAIIFGASRASLGVEQAIRIDGSGTVTPITRIVATQFQRKQNAVKTSIGNSGTDGSFERFCRGETDLSGASRLILKAEVEACARAGVDFLELPIALDPITVVVNPANTWATSLTVAELKQMWEPAAQGKVTRWKQVRASFPNSPLKLYGPDLRSGNLEEFTARIVGKYKAIRKDYTASEDDNFLVRRVAADRNGLTYFGYGYYAQNKDRLKAVAIDSGNGPVLPSEQTLSNGTYRTLSRYLFIYINAKSADRPEVNEFVEYYLQSAPTLVRQANYVPLTEEVYGYVQRRFQQRQTGSYYGGQPEVTP